MFCILECLDSSSGCSQLQPLAEAHPGTQQVMAQELRILQPTGKTFYSESLSEFGPTCCCHKRNESVDISFSQNKKNVLLKKKLEFWVYTWSDNCLFFCLTDCITVDFFFFCFTILTGSKSTEFLRLFGGISLYWNISFKLLSVKCKTNSSCSLSLWEEGSWYSYSNEDI